MGLLDFLFGGGKHRTNVEVVPDHIWMTSEAKFAGLAKEALERSKSETVAVLLVAHFPDVLERLNEIASLQGFEAPCKAILASNLNKDLANQLRLEESAIIDIIVGERHPLRSADDFLVDIANNLPCRCRFSYHVSLDDAVMKAFASDWMKKVLKGLGMKEDEAIESEMVSRRIRKAQQQIEGGAFGSLDAESAAEWLTKNCPELNQK